VLSCDVRRDDLSKATSGAIYIPAVCLFYIFSSLLPIWERTCFPHNAEDTHACNWFSSRVLSSSSRTNCSIVLSIPSASARLFTSSAFSELRAWFYLYIFLWHGPSPSLSLSTAFLHYLRMMRIEEVTDTMWCVGFGKQNETAEPSRRMKRIPSQIIYFPITLYKSAHNITVELSNFKATPWRLGLFIRKEIIPCRITE